jgi:hypothetical protein
MRSVLSRSSSHLNPTVHLLTTSSLPNMRSCVLKHIHVEDLNTLRGPLTYHAHTTTLSLPLLESRVSGLLSSALDVSLLLYSIVTRGYKCTCFDRGCVSAYTTQKVKISSSDIRPFKMKPLNCLEASRTSHPVPNAGIIKASAGITIIK